MGAPVIAAVVSGAFQFQSARQAKKAGKATREAARVQERIAEVQNARARRRAIASSRRERARVTAAAAGTGALGSSALAGFQAGGVAALGSNISFQQGLGALEGQRIASLGRAAGFQGQASFFAGLSSVAGGLGKLGQIKTKPTFDVGP